MNIRKQISHIFKPSYMIPEDQWEESFNRLQREGRVTLREVIDIMIVLLKREEEREQKENSAI